jgi:hypothetical protein
MRFLWNWYICGLNSPALYQLSYRGINLVLSSKKIASKRCLKQQALAEFTSL